MNPMINLIFQSALDLLISERVDKIDFRVIHLCIDVEKCE